ncbi:MAG: hypothetical protein HY936_07945 [Nitrosomonadales bacterium]|nr:hypothetical protein [Nitrosomonadales bacterium]
MKLNKFALTLTVAALLPTFAYAGTDAVAASFERDMYREPANSTIAITGEADPLTDLFNTALNGTTDQVWASFERDMYREPANSTVAITGEADQLVNIFNVALRTEVNKPVRQIAIRGKHHHGS